MNTPVLYFHGFASSPASAKITSLRPLLEPRGIELITPDLNAPSFRELDWPSVVERAIDEAHRTQPRAVCGSSLGALVALEVVAAGIRAPLVLIAPALGVAERWQQKLPPGDPIHVWNHTIAAEAPVHRSFFLQMAALHVDELPPPVRTVAIMGRLDETVPFHCVEETWQRWERLGLAEGSRLIVIDDGDHGLTAHVDLIAREILSAAL